MSVFFDSLLSVIYPQACQICKKSVEKQSDGYVCSDCWQETYIFSNRETLCSKCGAFLHDSPTQSETYCYRCNEDSYDSAKAIGKYEKALLISTLNLKHTPHISKRLENLLFNSFLSSEFQNTEIIIPVPLSKKRLAERGFNQAEIIAQKISKKTKLPIDKMSLQRKTHTVKHRAGMDRKARIESVQNSFEVVSPRLIEGKRILLIDDVFASGATVSNCAKVLKKAGAEKVYVLTIARSV